MVVAVLALVLALGGSAFGGPIARLASAISGGQIKAHSIAGDRLKKNTVTGKQVKESSLDIVPRAKTATTATSATHAGSADTATNATHASSADTATSATHAGSADTATAATNAAEAANASAVDGVTVRTIFYAPAAATATETTILSLGGLTLKASCNSGIVSIPINSAVDHTHFSSEMWNSGGGGQADGLHHTDFNTNNSDDLTDQNDWGETSFTYTTPSGTIVDGQISFDSDAIIGGNIFNHAAKCLVSGFARSTASS
jgi:hypothetical protein